MKVEILIDLLLSKIELYNPGTIFLRAIFLRANSIFCQCNRTIIGKHIETHNKCATLSLKKKMVATKRLQDSNILNYNSIDYIARKFAIMTDTQIL